MPDHPQQEAAMDFRDRQVVVTGGTGALGTAIVGALLEAGATCRVPYLHASEAERFAHRGHPNVKLIADAQLAEEATVARLFESVPGLWASIHLAGGFASGPVTEVSKRDLMQQLDMNFVTCFLCCREAVKAIRRAGGGGRIVNVAARPALEWRAGAGMAAYAASKSAVAAFSVALGEELAKEAILVNAIAPSILDTPANRQAMPNADHTNWPKVEEVAQTVLFLASPDNKVTRSGVIPVYGRS
jgi:NAD(P)-dependent dehydrogenase (short-subunit alcohol dehydrogenase family)